MGRGAPQSRGGTSAQASTAQPSETYDPELLERVVQAVQPEADSAGTPAGAAAAAAVPAPAAAPAPYDAQVLEEAWADFLNALAQPDVLRALERSGSTERQQIPDDQLQPLEDEIRALRARIFPAHARIRRLLEPLLEVVPTLAGRSSVASWERERRAKIAARQEREARKRQRSAQVTDSFGLDDVLAGRVPGIDDLPLDDLPTCSRSGSTFRLAPTYIVSATRTTSMRLGPGGRTEYLRRAETVGELRGAGLRADEKLTVLYDGGRTGELAHEAIRIPKQALAQAVAARARSNA